MEARRIKLNRFAVYAWTVLACNLAVIVWGAYVRASSSGDGCGSHWPLCNGEMIPQSPGTKTLVELTHRLTSGLALLLVVGLVFWAFRAFRKGHPARTGAALSGVFIVSEALIGAGLVLLKLVGGDASIARATYLSLHLVNTFVLLAALALTAWWASGGRALRRRAQGSMRWELLAALLCVLAVGVSGAVAALGSTLFAESPLTEIARRDLSPASQLLFSLRHYKLHPLLAGAFGVYLIWVAAAAKNACRDVWVKRWAWALVALVLVQFGAGLLNAALLAPVWLQLVHLLLADMLWLALVLLAASALAQAEATEETFERVRVRQTVEA
ncbi:MAG: COX15/CtaA family protein [Acidobacteria bacterium]|nr:COX15/CtaA family protein [Acidobacteriota bacterium]